MSLRLQSPSRSSRARPAECQGPVLEALESRALMSLPAGFAQTTFASGITAPTAMAFAPDGRLFVCEQDGDVRVVNRQGQLLATPFAHFDVRNDGEQGLIGIAFHPDFANNGQLFVHYATPNALNRIARVTADPASPNVAAAGSLVEIVTLPRDGTFGYNHQGGALGFGPDGKLYMTSGEHNHPAYAQDRESPYGKILRLNPDGTFPADNPFYANSSGWGRAVWAMGLRNPYTFAFQPGTGRVLINDVGGGLREEVNLGQAGANFGWPATEGKFNPAAFPSYTNPVHDYVRGEDGCAIIGAAFYDPPPGATNPFPATYRGKYFFSDYCSRFIHALDPANNYTHSVFGTDNQLPAEAVDLEVGPDGSLYGLSRGAGAGAGAGVVVKISYTASNAPVISSDPESKTVTVGRPVTFMVSASGAAPLSYKWQRKSAGASSYADIPGATADNYTIGAVAASDDGAQFRAVVTNASGTAISNPATLTVTSNRPPTATFVFPAAGATYAGGQTIEYAATANDPEDGTLPSSAYTWWVVFHHDTHTHPFVPPRSGSAFGNFTIPTVGETAADVWYRIHLQVTDSQGLSQESFRDVHPRTARITLAAEPAGAGLTIDLEGASRETPLTFTGVAGIIRNLGAPATQTVNGVTYEFVGWSDGGAREHAISTPDVDTTYTAVYRRVARVVGRYVFYSRSRFDADGAASGPGDDGAVATDKQALLPGQSASFAHYTSYSRGINGVMIDLDNGGAPLGDGDFSFRVGRGGDVAGWAQAPQPLRIERRGGAGAGGFDRVTIVWADGVIRNEWLQVTYLPEGAPPTSLSRDVFYFGNLVGETGNGVADARVTALDLLATRRRLRSRDLPITDRHDFNRDGKVTVVDYAIVRRNLWTSLPLITPPATGGVASATSAALVSSTSVEASVTAAVLER